MENTNEGSTEGSMEQLANFYDTTDTTELEGEDVEIEPTSRAMVSRSVRLSRETMNAIRKIADERNMGVTQLMRQWILERLTEEQAQKTPSSSGEVLKVPFTSLTELNEAESAEMFSTTINRVQKRGSQQSLVQAKRQVARTLGKHEARVRIS